MALKIVRHKNELRQFVPAASGLVPTMGAFHEGHLHLMRAAKAECGFCAVSLFVNPTQFGPGEDFARYPRNENRDFEMAESAGADLLYAPTVEEMYGDSIIALHAGELGKMWEGAHRPGHFDGVATVVAKLFHQFGSETAYFGLKDFQQCVILARLVEDLDFPIRLRLLETVRESDGLAMSSRNSYLSPEDRKIAPFLYQSLIQARDRLRLEASDAQQVLDDGQKGLVEKGFDVDYFAWIDSRTLQTVHTRSRDSRIIAAARLGKTRLIDNCPV